MEYSTGAFAKKSKVSERTIRYYDNIGLLKPSHIKENGYRVYTDEDFNQLQIISSLKTLGFSLDDIQAILLNKNPIYIQESLEVQLELLTKKIMNMQSLKYRIEDILASFDKDRFSIEEVKDIIDLQHSDENFIDHYYTSRNLDIRANLHNQFRTNKKTWFEWLWSKINIKGMNRVIDIGCGNGSLWIGKDQTMRNRQLFLCDISEGMIDTAKRQLGNEYSYVIADCENLGFQNNYFDLVVANHMLFYLKNIDKGLEEIHRVLRDDGVLYASAYGSIHMKELNTLVQGFDDRIELSSFKFYDIFGVENGKQILEDYFYEVKYYPYEDTLYVDSTEDIVNYILSCHGNQMTYLTGRLGEFHKYVDDFLVEHEILKIEKEVGLFVAKNKR